MIDKKIIYGSLLEDNLPPKEMLLGRGVVSLPGNIHGDYVNLDLSDDVLSKHSLIIGGTGCGKTKLFYHFVSQIKRRMTKHDVMIIFDTKGDYYSRFASPSDLVIGNSPQFYSKSEKWNIFKEILADGWEQNMYSINTQEICRSFFEDSISRTNNIFFPQAASDLLSSLICSYIRAAVEDNPSRGHSPIATEYFYNDKLIEYLNTHSPSEICYTLGHFPENKAIISYIDGDTEQCQGVISELHSVVRKLLVGSFADHGLFSMRDFIRKKGGRTLFVEYDMSIGKVLSPIYSILFDLALKEALGRQSSEGNVYLFCDEFRLLPLIQHIDDGVNFGRSLGVKIFAGLQSIEQLYEVYKKERGKNIAAGFSSIYAFKANDTSTRNFIRELFGKNILLEKYTNLERIFENNRREGYSVEDWDLIDLKIGEAVVGLPFQKPFKMYFKEFK